MSTKVVEGRIQSKIATESNWKTVNPVLLKGELAIESDTNYVKVGNGANHYKDLPYLTTPLNVDSQVTTNSNNLITSGAVAIAVSNALSSIVDGNGVDY